MVRRETASGRSTQHINCEEQPSRSLSCWYPRAVVRFNRAHISKSVDISINSGRNSDLVERSLDEVAEVLRKRRG